MKHLLLALLISFSTYSFGQLDASFGIKKSKNSNLSIGSTPIKNIEKPSSLDFNNDNGFKTAHKKQQAAYKKKKQEQLEANKGIITPALQRKITLQKKAEKYNFEIPMIDMDLGSFRTTSTELNISAFDFGYLDGDVISISRNGKPIITNYTLTKSKKLFKIPLEIGFNRIEIIATNEGKLRPNTGAFTAYDNNNNVVISNMWNLAQGAKVIALVIREKN